MLTEGFRKPALQEGKTMSLQANIDHLAIASGIEAVVVDTGSRNYRGDQTWHPVLDGALDLFHRTDEKSIRLVVGKHTIVVQRENEETVAVVLPTGHAIAKSLRRMIRRMARKNRGPLPKAKQVLVTGAPATGPAQSTPPSGGQPSVPPVTKPAEEPKATAPAPAATPTSPSTDRGFPF
jgi:hypothetical protein